MTRDSNFISFRWFVRPCAAIVPPSLTSSFLNLLESNILSLLGDSTKALRMHKNNTTDTIAFLGILPDWRKNVKALFKTNEKVREKSTR